MAPSANPRLSTIIPPPSAEAIAAAECTEPNRRSRRTLSRLPQLQWRPRHMQGTTPRMLFMIGFLINSTAMAGLFYLLDHEWTTKKEVRSCIQIHDLYVYSIRSAFPFFTLVSLAAFAIIFLMQFRRYKIEDNSYLITTVLGSAKFFASAALLLISSFGIMMKDKDCKPSPSDIQELQSRYVFQSTAAFFTASVYLLLGFLLIKRRQTVDPIPPQSPVFQIQPPGFDSMFPPPPTYQQSQIHHHESLRRQNQQF
ncbi:hypothetical protein M3Y98_00800700 [Aphelenchoides besseyi]|nr:hypothetical protein M3Y98_00800700 [Aphelenchoides besseyi]KAI6212034.1 hypothetical protein M3Y96_00497500 [Aphelenchoides besseyi]